MGDERALLLGGLLALCGALGLVLLPALACQGGGAMPEVIVIHRDSAFYRARPEPEVTLIGWLRSAPVVTGPDTRDLPIHFEDADGSLPLYAVGPAEERLRPLIDRRVRLVGRRVDLRDEGLALELWPAWVSPAEAPGID
jgi:hypothetical protein